MIHITNYNGFVAAHQFQNCPSFNMLVCIHVTTAGVQGEDNCGHNIPMEQISGFFFLIVLICNNHLLNINNINPKSTKNNCNCNQIRISVPKSTNK